MKRAMKWANNLVVDLPWSWFLPPKLGFVYDVGWVMVMNAIDISTAISLFVVGAFFFTMTVALPAFAQETGMVPPAGTPSLPPQWVPIFSIVAMLIHTSIKELGPVLRTRSTPKTNEAACNEIRVLEKQIEQMREDHRRIETRLADRFEEDRKRLEDRLEDDIRRVMKQVEDYNRGIR